MFKLILLGLAIYTQATVMGDLAVAMKPGEWREFSANGLTRDLIDDGGGHNILQYSDNALWCPKAKRFLFLGSGHMRPGKRIAYSDNTNRWALVQGLGGIAGPHSNDHNAINPVTGIVYNRATNYNNRRVNQYNGSWSALPDIQAYGTQCCSALEFFPERNSLIFVDNYGGYGQVLELSLSTPSWKTLSTGHAMGGYLNIAEYSPVHKVIIFGGGNDSRDVHRLDASGTVTTMNNAPIPLGVWHHSVFTVDPVSGDFLVLGADRSFRQYNPITDTWTTLPDIDVPIWNVDQYGGGPLQCIVAAPVSTYGVNMFLTWNSGDPKAYLYKHSPSGSTALDSRPIKDMDMNISLPMSIGKADVSVYDLKGVLVRQCRNITTPFYTFHEQGLNSGFYILKIKTGDRLLTQRLIISK